MSFESNNSDFLNRSADELDCQPTAFDYGDYLSPVKEEFDYGNFLSPVEESAEFDCGEFLSEQIIERVTLKKITITYVGRRGEKIECAAKVAASGPMGAVPDAIDLTDRSTRAAELFIRMMAVQRVEDFIRCGYRFQEWLDAISIAIEYGQDYSPILDMNLVTMDTITLLCFAVRTRQPALICRLIKFISDEQSLLDANLSLLKVDGRNAIADLSEDEYVWICDTIWEIGGSHTHEIKEVLTVARKLGRVIKGRYNDQVVLIDGIPYYLDNVIDLHHRMEVNTQYERFLRALIEDRESHFGEA